jgi:23S rRNA (cytosine1962-C5)-methyltransferase
MARDHELVDAGGGRRLDRFAGVLIDRPAPGAEAPQVLPDTDWQAADGRFDRSAGWSWRTTPPEDWVVELDGLAFALRPAEAGQVGLFPEQAIQWPWLAERQRGPVLNLFAYTGATTLALARMGNAVTHVDASRTALTWARENAARSGLAGSPIRWILDDVADFVGREARRAKRYRGAILDPPTYGHGPGGRAWRMERDLPGLLESIRAVLEPDGWLVVTTHTRGLDLRQLVGRGDTGTLELQAASGATLSAGHYVRGPAS